MRRTRSCEIYIDGASRGNPGPAGIGAVFLAPGSDGAGKPLRQLSKPLGVATNNVAEYLALIYALQEAAAAGYNDIRVRTDSELLVRQLNGQYKVRQPHLRVFHDLARQLIRGFDAFGIAHVPRERNRAADRLAGQAAARALAGQASRG
jgi:ribonuclease HI